MIYVVNNTEGKIYFIRMKDTLIFNLYSPGIEYLDLLALWYWWLDFNLMIMVFLMKTM